MESPRAHFSILFFGAICLATKSSVKAYPSNLGGLTQNLNPENDLAQIIDANNEDKSNLSDINANGNYKVLKKVGISGLHLPKDNDNHYTPPDSTELEGSLDFGQTQQKEGQKKLGKRGKQLQTRGLESENGTGFNSGGLLRSYVTNGNKISVSNHRGVSWKVSSPSKPQNIVIGDTTVAVNGRTVCENIQKIGTKQTYQKAEDGAMWYTNLNVGDPMTPKEIEQFEKQEMEREAEKKRKRERKNAKRKQTTRERQQKGQSNVPRKGNPLTKENARRIRKQ